MSAQPGGALVLQYGPQGARQDGAALVLKYGSGDAVRRRVVASLRAPWADSRPEQREWNFPFLAAFAHDSDLRARWAAGRPLQDERRGPWGTQRRVDESKRMLWGQYSARPSVEIFAQWGLAQPVDESLYSLWGEYAHRPQIEPRMPWAVAVQRDQNKRMPWGRYAARPSRELSTPWARVRRVDLEQWFPWTRYSRQVDPEWGIPQPPGGPPVDDNGTIIVPEQESYIVLNTVNLIRVSDAAEIPNTGVTVSLDRTTWSWSFSASLPRSSLSLVESAEGEDPVEVQLTINGEPLRFVVENIDTEREFARGTVRLTCRSKTSALAEPTAPNMSFFNEADRTAEQLANDVLTDNGVPIGWSLVFDPVDWLVPAGAWSHQGTYITALTAIAAAAGGYLQPHDTLEEVRIRLDYPVAPWDWGDVIPDIELPAAIVTREGIQRLRKATYDRVFVQGQANGGVQGRVTRTGTAGTRVAPSVIDALITEEAAARQRGIPVLADVGRIAMVDLRLPVLEDVGIIRPGWFVRYVDDGITRIGLVRGVSVSVALPNVYQTVTVETHGY